MVHCDTCYWIDFISWRRVSFMFISKKKLILNHFLLLEEHIDAVESN
eukprot:UN20006